MLKAIYVTSTGQSLLSVQRFKLHNTTGTMYLNILQSVLPTQHTPKSKLDKHTIYRHTKHLSVTNSHKKKTSFDLISIG